RASECAVSARSERSEPRSREQDGAVSARSERSEPRSREQDGAVSARSERSEPRSREQDGAVKAADFRARHRGGGLFTETVNQRLGAYLCVPAYRFGLAPTVLTLANLVLGLAAAAGVAVLAGRAPAPLVGLGALVLWHLAYSLDCADGQLARVTGQASRARAGEPRRGMTPVTRGARWVTAGLLDQVVIASANAGNTLLALALLDRARAGTLILSIGLAYLVIGVNRAFVGDVLLALASR